MTRLISLSMAAALLFAAFASTTVRAEQGAVCAPRDAILEKLTNQFKETRRSFGLQGAAAVFEIYASEQGTWTMIVTQATGMTCVLAAGDAWSEEKSALLAEGDPA
jgi:hypothetical protein